MSRGIGKTELESILASNPRMIGSIRGMSMSGFLSKEELETLVTGSVEEDDLVPPSTPDSLLVDRIARATYDFAVDGGAIGAIGLGVTLPDNAVVKRAWYEVLTTLASATDAATVSLDIPVDDVAGLLAAIAISDATNPWDAGHHECIQDGTAANFSEKCTAARELSMTVAVEALTAGKFILFVEYIVSD